MTRRTPLLNVMLLVGALAVSACGGEPTSLPDGEVPPVDGGTMPPPSGEASLGFEPRWGPAAASQINANWRPTVPFWDGASPVVLMLCQTSDPTCESPFLVREVAAAESDGDPIQGSFGPAITMRGLPSGTYLAMIFTDTTRSRELGFGWQDGFETRERAWGGVVSEGDLMLSASDDPPGTEHNPAPVPVEVTLRDGETTELGVVHLAHLHERDLSGPPRAESGRLAVVVEGGVRVLDLSTYDVLEVLAGSGVYTFQMTDAAGETVDGSVCGAIRGAGSTVYVLYTDATGGFAIPFDVAAATQLYGGHRVDFAGDTVVGPCRGDFVEAGGRSYLYVTAGTENAPPGEGIWYADVTDLASADVAATFMNRDDDEVLRDGIDRFARHGDTLYAAFTPPSTSTTAPAECLGHHSVLMASLDASGRPDFGGPGAYRYLVGPELSGGVTTSQGAVACTEIGESGEAGLAVARFHDGRDLLFLGGCTEIAVFDLSDGTRLDYNDALPGRPGIDGTLFGNGFSHLQVSADGERLWALPRTKSAFPLNHQLGPDGGRQTFNRYMALPIDLTTGSLPALDAAFASGDIDGYQGPTSVGEYVTPADDPGVDLNFGRYIGYQVRWAPSTAGVTFGSQTIPFAPTFVVTANSLFMRDSNESLQKAGNVAVYDLASREAVMFTHDSDHFYRFWQGGHDNLTYFGLDLTPENDDVLPTYAVLYVP